MRNSRSGNKSEQTFTKKGTQLICRVQLGGSVSAETLLFLPQREAECDGLPREQYISCAQAAPLLNIRDYEEIKNQFFSWHVDLGAPKSRTCVCDHIL